jgi:hypothetical protein
MKVIKMKGITVTSEQFEKIPLWIKDRLIGKKIKENKVMLMDATSGKYGEIDLLGEAVCAISGMHKLPSIDKKGELVWIYPNWEGETIEE